MILRRIQPIDEYHCKSPAALTGEKSACAPARCGRVPPPPPCLVRPTPANLAMARNTGPLRSARLGGHASADASVACHGALSALPPSLSEGRGARRRSARRGARELGGTRLLRPGEQSPCRRVSRGGQLRWSLSS